MGRQRWQLFLSNSGESAHGVPGAWSANRADGLNADAARPRDGTPLSEEAGLDISDFYMAANEESNNASASRRSGEGRDPTANPPSQRCRFERRKFR